VSILFGAENSVVWPGSRTKWFETVSADESLLSTMKHTGYVIRVTSLSARRDEDFWIAMPAYTFRAWLRDCEDCWRFSKVNFVEKLAMAMA
jgi:hypothetical protein